MLDWSNGAIRASMLFGVLAIAMALFVTPLLDRGARNLTGAAGIDMITTASTPNRSSYTVRRSVLQPSPASVCIIRADGTRSGDC